MRPPPGPVDPDTYQRTDLLVSMARHRGWDVTEYLNRAGLLLTPAQSKRIRVEALEYILDEMQRWRPAEFLRRHDRSLVTATPDELYRCIVEWMEDHVTAAKEKP